MTKLIGLNRFSILAFILLTAILLPVQAAQMRPGERLEYTFSYRGILSGFIQMNIAQAVFGVQPGMDSIQGREAYLTSLDLTTEPYGKAEMIYPIRYRYRSWLEPERQTPLLVNEYLETDEVSEELLWFDRENLLGYRFVKGGEPVESQEMLPKHLLDKAGLSKDDWSLLVQENRQVFSDEGVWDYLSLLYRLRFLELETGRVFDLPLFNGKRIKLYRVEVVQERLKQGGWNRAAYKLSLHEVRKGKQQRDSITAVWVSDDEARLPLRFYVKRAFGAVEGILETGRPLTARGDDFSEATKSSLDLVF